MDEQEHNQTSPPVVVSVKKSPSRFAPLIIGGVLGVALLFLLQTVLTTSFSETSQNDPTSEPEHMQTESTTQEEPPVESVIYEDKNYKITYLGISNPTSGLITVCFLKLKITNNSDKNIMLSLREGYVNDISVSFLGGNDSFDGLAPGKSAICTFSFGYANHGIESIDDIEKIEFKLSVTDTHFNTLKKTNRITINP